MSYVCAISGTVPEEPVVSTKSGHVFERRLIEKHIKSTDKCPVTEEELSLEDLVPLKVSKAVKPKETSSSSIPSMIQVFQNEWDALMLETYKLKQHLDAVRQELAHALYQHDAACRVIARLVRERDAARSAYGDTSTNVRAAVSGAMSTKEEQEETGITAAAIKKMQETAKALSKTRKKLMKDLGAEVVSNKALKKYSLISSHPLHSASKPGVLCLDIHTKMQDKVLTGGADGSALIFNKKTNKIESKLTLHKKKVTSVKFHPTRDLAFTTSADNTTAIWGSDSGNYTVKYHLRDHSKAVVGCTLHPSGDFLVTASADQTWGFYDIETGVCRKKVADEKITAGYTRIKFHPDGLILGAGTADSQVKIFDVKQQKNVATFKGHFGEVTGLSFSGNGYYLASGDEEGTVKLWDLRKLQNFQTISTEKIKAVRNLDFDASGQYLAVAGQDLRVFSSKGWSLVKSFPDHKSDVTAVQFGNNASFIASTSKDRTLKFWA